MKTLILVTICTMMFGAASYAQIDTTKSRLQQDTSRNRIGIRPTPAQPAQPVQPVQPAQPQMQPQVVPTAPQAMPQTTTPASPQSSPTGWTPVNNNQAIPGNLQQTISSPQYQGGTLYTNPDNGMYQLRTNSPGNPQVIYFDKDGKVTTAPPHD